MAPVEAGNVTVVTVAPLTVIRLVMGVKYVVLVARLELLSDGKVAGSVKLTDGPPSICGQGGRVMVLAVELPFPSGNVTTTGPISTLGKTVMGTAPDDVTLTLEYGIPSVTIEGTEMVTVVVVVAKTVVATPPMVVLEKPPYSNEVVKLLGRIVVAAPNDFVGMMS